MTHNITIIAITKYSPICTPAMTKPMNKWPRNQGVHGTPSGLSTISILMSGEWTSGNRDGYSITNLTNNLKNIILFKGVLLQCLVLWTLTTQFVYLIHDQLHNFRIEVTKLLRNIQISVRANLCVTPAEHPMCDILSDTIRSVTDNDSLISS